MSTNNSTGSVSSPTATDTVLAPNLTITKTGNGTLNSTDTVKFTITVSNTGTGTAYNVTVTDVLPDSAHLNWTTDAGAITDGTGEAYIVNLSDPLPDSAHLTWTTSTPGASVSGGTLTDAIGTLPAGTSVTIHVSAVTPAGYNATLTNTATATSSNTSSSSVQ